MFEKIYAFVLSLQANIVTQEEYSDYLDTLFLGDSKNELLLELEFASNDLAKTFAVIKEALYKRKKTLEYNVFGRVLFENIRNLYEKNSLGMEAFGHKMYRLWNLLPSEINQIEPFWTLSYADDCLSYGDEVQTRKLYEDTFVYKWSI